MKKKTHLTQLLFVTIILSTAAPRLFLGQPISPPATAYKLVFSDHFATDPSSNGKWTIYRTNNNTALEANWDSGRKIWYLTRADGYLGAAVFANYELTDTVWKASFRYRVDNGPTGADGFIFMFYKDKGAYSKPYTAASGSAMGFEVIQMGKQYHDIPVAGYGLQFDTYQETDCDPVQSNYVAIAQDTTCGDTIWQPFTGIDDNTWHNALVSFDNGSLALTVDGEQILTTTISGFDYTYTGVGFGAGTGEFYANQAIDDFELFVATN